MQKMTEFFPVLLVQFYVLRLQHPLLPTGFAWGFEYSFPSSAYILYFKALFLPKMPFLFLCFSKFLLSFKEDD